MKLSERSKFLLCAVSVVLVTVWLYGPTRSLPLMFDDLLHIRLASEVDFTTVWLPSTRFGFYRPFVFLPLLLIKQTFGHYPAELLHWFNILQHALNSFLVAWLAWRLWGGWRPALAAGLFLATYPFAYQAVAMYGNNIYPTSASILLVLLHFNLSAVRSARHTQRWQLVTVLLFAVGLLSHETVVLFGPLAVLLQVGNKTVRRDAFIFTILGGLYIVGYQFLPIGGGPTDDLGTTALLPKLLYLVQTAVHPIAWLASLHDALSEAWVLIGATILIGLSAWATWRGRWRGVLFGWGWWLLASAVIGINLPTYYILHGARLVYLSGIGGALIWALLLDEMGRSGDAGRLITPMLLLLIGGPSSQFVANRINAFHDIATPVRVMQQTLTDDQSDAGVLLVNLPAWTAPTRTTYPIGVEYVTLMGFHLFAEELVAENVGGQRSVLAIDAPDLLANPHDYAYGIHDQAQLDHFSADWATGGSHIFINRYTAYGIKTDYSGQFTPPTETAMLATTSGYTLHAMQDAGCDHDALTIELVWSVADSAEIGPTVSIFVQLLDADGKLIGQSDGPPLGLNPASYTLPSEWQMVDRRTLNAHAQLGATLLIGSYDFTNGQRFTITDAQNNTLANDALALPVTTCVH